MGKITVENSFATSVVPLMIEKGKDFGKIGETEYPILGVRFTPNESQEIVKVLRRSLGSETYRYPDDLIIEYMQRDCAISIHDEVLKEDYNLGDLTLINLLIKYRLLDNVRLPLLGQEVPEDNGSILPLFMNRGWELLYY